MSDDGGIDSVVSEQGNAIALSSPPQSETEKVYAWDSNTPAQQSDESIESMAMISVPQYEVTQPTEVLSSPVGKLCRGCNATIPHDEPFCLQCGLDA